MKWRDIVYETRYVVRRICNELGAEPTEVWDILDAEFDKEVGAPMTAQEAAELEEIVLAGMRFTAAKPESRKPEEILLTRDQAAVLMKMHPNTLDIERKSGRLAYIQRRPGGRVYISMKAVNDYLTRSLHPATPEYRMVNTYRKRRVV